MIKDLAGVMGQFTPTLNLDFMKAAMPSGLTFSRTGTATRVNAAGNIETVAANLPRFDYDPATLALKGLLIEESRTNLALKSEEFDDAYWNHGRTNYTFSYNQVAAPNGTLTADRLINGGNSTLDQGILRDVQPFANGAYAISVYVRAGSATSARLSLKNAVSDTVKGFTSITNLNSSWQRISVAATTDGTTAGVRFELSTNGATGSIYFWGAQVEAGTFATSYIPTTTASVTRGADVCIANTAGWFNQNQGTLIGEWIAKAGLDQHGVAVYSTANSANAIRLRKNNNNQTQFTVRTIGPDLVGGAFATDNTIIRMGASYGNGSASLSYTGSSLYTGNSTLSTPFDQLLIGGNLGGFSSLNSHFRLLKYWPTKRPNSYLQSLTT